MNPFTRVLLIILVIAVGLVTALIGFRALKLCDKKLTVFQKIKKSFTCGFMFSISIFAFFSAIPISLWNDSHLNLDINTTLSFFFLMFMPCVIIVTIGMFIQISYLEFLVHSGKKE